jgi:GMP synthase (glutamine-hydrolysing)
VVRGAAGTEAGLVSVSWTPAARDDVLVADLPEPMLTPSLHDDEIVELPAGAVLLGGTATYPHQVFRVGHCAWGVQFHPELSPDWYDAWARSIPTLDAAGTGAVLRAADADVQAGGAALARRFAAVAGRVA